MNYICSDKVLFYQENGEADRLEKLQATLEMFPYDPENEEISPNWMGYLTRLELKADDNIDDRCLYVDSFLEDDTLLLYAESLNTPKTEVYDKIAAHFGIKYHLLAEEPQNEIFINTDISREHFDQEFAVIITCAEETMLEELQLQISESYPSVEALLDDFKGAGYVASSLQELRKILSEEANEYLKISVVDYQNCH